MKVHSYDPTTLEAESVVVVMHVQSGLPGQNFFQMRLRHMSQSERSMKAGLGKCGTEYERSGSTCLMCSEPEVQSLTTHTQIR